MKAEAVVIGGGLAGSSVAILLARAGRDVILLEREASPQHKVCGEFLSHEALHYLQRLGIDSAALGAVPIHHVRFAGKAVRLPFAAMSLTRRCLDEALLQRAQQAGVRVVRGRHVQSLTHASQWMAIAEGRDTITADAAFLATGKHDLRGWARPPGTQNDLVAMKMYFQLDAAQAAELDGHVELTVYRGGYAGLQPVEDGLASLCCNLCCLVQRTELQRLGGHWQHLLEAMTSQSPHLHARLHQATPLLAKALAISSIPYGMVRPPLPGLWCLGDQAVVIPSFTGDGMSIALHSAALAAKMYLAGESPEACASSLQSHVRTQVRLATAVSRSLVAQPRLMSAAAHFWPGVVPLLAKHTRIAAELLAS